MSQQDLNEDVERLKREVRESFVWEKVSEWANRHLDAARTILEGANEAAILYAAQGRVKAFKDILDAPNQIITEWKEETRRGEHGRD